MISVVIYIADGPLVGQPIKYKESYVENFQVGQGERTAKRADKSQVRGEHGWSAASEETMSKKARRARERSSERRQETRDERRETRDERRETRDERRETRDERRETRDERRERKHTSFHTSDREEEQLDNLIEGYRMGFYTI
ncbi:hypothetical protein V8E53_009905 [Lactarius tabidus]